MEAIARPGDTVIIGLASPTDSKAMDEIASRLRGDDGIPYGVRVVIVNNVSSMVVVRNDTLARAQGDALHSTQNDPEATEEMTK